MLRLALFILSSAVLAASQGFAQEGTPRPFVEQRNEVVQRATIRDQYLTRMKTERRLVYVPDDGSAAQPFWNSILPAVGARAGWRLEWRDAQVPVTEVHSSQVTEMVRQPVVRLGFRDADGNRLTSGHVPARWSARQPIGGIDRLDGPASRVALDRTPRPDEKLSLK